MTEVEMEIRDSIIEARAGSLDQVVQVNMTITEWDSHFSKEFLEEYLQNKATLITIGFCDNQPVGFTVGYAEGNSFYRWISGVNPGFRAKGVFRKMHEECERRAKEKGLTKMKSDVALRRQAMVETNRALGYKVVGFEYGEDLPNSRLFFEKDL